VAGVGVRRSEEGGVAEGVNPRLARVSLRKEMEAGMRKVFAVALVVLLVSLAPLFATGKDESQPGSRESASIVNKTGFPIVKQPLTLKFMGRRAPVHGPWANMLVFTEYEKMTGIKIQWEEVPDAGYRERLNLVLASGDLPDAIFRAALTPNDVAKYGPDGTFVPLEGLVKTWGANLNALFATFPAALSSSQAADMHMYALPAFVTLDAARTDKFWMNKKWLDKLGLKAPETFDDLKKVLTAFRDKDPNGNGKADEIPMTARGFQDGQLRQLMVNHLGSFGINSQFGYWVNVENGKAAVWVGDARVKALLQIWADFYKEKLLDNNFPAQTAQEFLAKNNSDTTGYFQNQADDTFVKYSADFVGIAPFIGPNGKRGVYNLPVARDFGTFVITKANKYPEATMRWIDYFYSKDGSRFFRMGIEGKTYYKTADGKYVYSDEIMKDPRGTGATIGQMTTWPQGGSPHLIDDENSIAVNSAVTSKAQVALQPYLDKPVYGIPIFSPEDQATAVTIRTDLDTYVLENMAKFITGAQDFSQWDAYVAGLEKIGIKKLDALYQKTLERMTAKK
jgi:putative aldouronate transport system substrate-binding protein